MLACLDSRPRRWPSIRPCDDSQARGPSDFPKRRPLLIHLLLLIVMARAALELIVRRQQDVEDCSLLYRLKLMDVTSVRIKS